MLLESSSAKTKFLNRYFRSTVSGRRFIADGPLQMSKLTVEDLVTLSCECVSSERPENTRSMLEEVLDDFQLESPITYSNPSSSDSVVYTCEEIRDDFVEYVTSLRPKPALFSTPAKVNLRSISYPGLHTPKHANQPEFRKTQSLQSVVSHASTTTTSTSATDSDYSMPITDDEEASPTRMDTIYVLPLDKGKGKQPESLTHIARRLSFTAVERSSTPIPSC
ncbi:hypothetical protein K493DRAFT_319678 [Basidiobolus meristosporus CBS 931.73]|uniref:Uncharacterized protein n=1 Tax=Basidiobolus meristosporus CBS 931.73 TaxID=1314790 RepID=A0A1Y1XNM4_9FUNG|nr:hypothetical protein K493DRAFT_319678 [Basidiobolus meristosporus CBS 931.73]|eukprot:ORX87348.1 hypothetical protein K493DRAFT_319678 [Basidiobolus meristosporus CBS 931.73]